MDESQRAKVGQHTIMADVTDTCALCAEANIVPHILVLKVSGGWDSICRSCAASVLHLALHLHEIAGQL